MSLTEFLEARIAEDEAVALESVGGDLSGWIKDEKLTDDCGLHPDTSAHIIRWDPARVLAECEAKRRIVERHALCGSGHGYCDDGGHGIEGLGCGELLDLALPYADHPHVLPEWLDP